MSSLPGNDPEARPEHLEQIRDIIFGAQKREIDTHLDEVKADIGSLRQSLADLSKSLSSEIQRAVRELEAKLAVQREQEASDKHELHSRINEAEARLQKGLQESVRSSTEKLEAVDAALRTELTRVRQDADAFRATIEKSLATATQTLDEKKLSRDLFAEALGDLSALIREGKRPSDTKAASGKKGS
jgi:hypothetical protein